MSNQVFGYLLLILSVVLYIIAAASFISMFFALTIGSTIVAIESAFGSMVIGILFLALAKMALRAGKRRLNTDADSGVGEGRK